MKKLLFSAVLLLVVMTAYSQGVSKMFGLVGGYPQSDHSSNGYLFSTDSTGNNFQLQYNFPVTTSGGNPANLELAAFNGKLYGTTRYGGVNNGGTIFEWNPATNVYTKKFDFGTSFSNNGGAPLGSLLLFNNKFYGLASSYGALGNGTIFEWDPATNIYSKKCDFTGSTGGNPQNSLRLLNNKMYGTTVSGGPTGIGVVFEWNPVTNAYTDLLDMNVSNGWGFFTNVTVYNNKLYCISHQGGANNYGAVYVIDPLLPNGSNTTIIKHLDATTGGTANNNEMIVYNNKLYGCLYGGGTNAHGTLFELNPATNLFTKLVDFNYSTVGANPLGRLVPNGSKFLGMCSIGGTSATGTIFEWDPATPNSVVKKYDFNANNQDNPISPGSTLYLHNSKFYGFSYNGGFADQGTLFEYDYAAGTVTKKLNFNAPENGRIPYGRPALLNGKLYGSCSAGPQADAGCIWEYDPSSNIYSRKYKFELSTSGTGKTPLGTLIPYNGKLYGTAQQGGVSNYGVVFSYDPATNVYNKTDIQTMGAGAYPDGDLTLYNNKFYGMMANGGTGNLGIVFSYDPANGLLTKLYDIASLGNGNSNPSSCLTVYNNKLYGCTNFGGANNNGVVFSFDPSNNTATSLADFNTPVTGNNVRNAFTVHNNKFYNTALSGGGSGRGTIFSFDPSNNTIANVYSFNTITGGNGYDPKGQLTFNGSKLYTTTMEVGGISIVVELDPATNIVIRKSAYSSTNNNLTVSRNALTVVPAFIANGISNNCETYPTVVINAANNNRWVPILNTAGDVVAEIKANGNNLGNVNASIYINNTVVREDGNKHLYLDRNINIAVQNQPSSNVDIRLYIKTSEFNAIKNAVNSLGQSSGINTINDIAIFKNDQNCAASFANTSAKINTVASNYEYGYVLAASINSFSSFYFARNNFTALPVSLVAFTASKQHKNVQLSWKTTNEINFSKFEVEKSIDAIHFDKLTTVAAENRSVNYYDAMDVYPVVGYNYYRLKMIDSDGSYKYSDIAKINFNEKPTLTLWPNPASNQLVVAEAKQNDIVVITDATGRVVLKKTIVRNNEPIIIQHLSAGIYSLQIFSGEQIIQSSFVKQ